MVQPRYKRVLLKLSGEAFCKEKGGLDTEEIDFIANELKDAKTVGAEIAIVVGGGNIVRGHELSQKGITQATGDYMGMLATVINALALQDVLEKKGLSTRVQTAIPIQSVAEPFIRRRSISHLEKGRVVILAAGTGSPHFTTDTAAALRATELGAQVLLKATKVDGVYSDDPHKNSKAKRFYTITYLDALNKSLGIMDATAISMCMEYDLPIIVFNLKKSGNITRAVKGEKIGTLVEGSNKRSSVKV